MPTGTPNAETLYGTNGNDRFNALAGNDLIISSLGNDTIDADEGYDTVDYMGLSAPITVKPSGELLKGNAGTDRLIQVENIIAPVGQINTIDASSAGGNISIEINLAGRYFNVSGIPGTSLLSVGASNFVNAIGSSGNDYLTGTAANNFLDAGSGNDGIDGGAGNDTLIGCAGSDYLIGNRGADRINGTNSFFRGVGEVDDLQGDAGNDRFIFGDRSGSYYKSHGSLDWVGIRDFSTGDRIELGLGEVYRADRTSFGFELYVTTGGVNELIGRVNTTYSVSLPTGNFAVNSGQTRGVFIGA